jgi:threonine/homoserine/homoserine lactone efflux protein
VNANILALTATVVVAHFLALISPGPDFLLVVKSAVKNTRPKAIGIAIGIAAANGIYIGLCILGVGSILAASLVLMTILKIAGGIFLIYVAYHALKAKKLDYAFIADAKIGAAENAGNSIWKEMLTGFISGISNPKNILFYLSLFSVVLTNEVSLLYRILLGLWMTLLVFAWDTFIIYVLSQNRIKSIFSRVAFYIDKIAGTILGLIGLKLIEGAVLEGKKI